MRIILTITLLTVLLFDSFSQETFTSRKGSKFFPGHLDIVITVDSKNVRYELFHHWYVKSYEEYRQMTIPLDRLDVFNHTNDTIKIELNKGNVKLIDKKYRLSRKVKHRNLCTSVSTMRNISFAYKLSHEYENIRHFEELYHYEDLQLEEEMFKQKVMERLNEKTKEQR